MREPLRAAWLAGSLAITLGLTTVGGALLGWYLDRKWGTAPWFALAGTLLGMGLGLVDAMFLVRRMDRGR